MAIILDNYTVLQQGRVEIDVHYSFDVRVSAENARKNAQRWLHDQISTQLSAQTPLFVVGEQPTWRVPVRLTLPSQGSFSVTSLDIDIATGELTDPKTAYSQTISALQEQVKPRLNTQRTTRPA